jgi:uncharacterized protein YjcR
VSLNTLHRFRIQQQLTRTLETTLQEKKDAYIQLVNTSSRDRTPEEVERIVNNMYLRLRDILVTNYHTTQKAEQYRAVFKKMLKSHSSDATSVEDARRIILNNLTKKSKGGASNNT